MDRKIPEAIVLAGGLGTRLQGVVADLPKSLAPVNGRPFAAYQLDMLAASGITRVIFATGHLAGKIESALGRDWNGMRLDYSVEDMPLGTGGAVRQAAGMANGDALIVFNGDTYLELDPVAFAADMVDAGAGIGVALADVADVARYGEVRLVQGRVLGFGEKAGHGPGRINAGVYYFSRSAIGSFPARRSFSLEKEVLEPAAAAGELHAFTDTAGFIDIGIPEDYARAQVLSLGWQTRP